MTSLLCPSCRTMLRHAFLPLAAGTVLAHGGVVHAQTGGATPLDPVVVTATRSAERAFDLPVAIDTVGKDTIQNGQLGVNQEKAAQVIPLLVPVVLRFLMKRLPYGSTAVPVITSLVEKQGYGSLDELAIRLAKHVTPESPAPGQSAPSIPTLLGRWAGKWFPSGDD